MYIAIKSRMERVPNPFYQPGLARIEPETIVEEVKTYEVISDKDFTYNKVQVLTASGYKIYKIEAEVTSKVHTVVDLVLKPV